MNEAALKVELQRAYRALAGIYRKVREKQLPDSTMLAYHSPTIAAALRYSAEDALDGSEFFIGKPVEVLHEALIARPNRPQPSPPSSQEA